MSTTTKLLETPAARELSNALESLRFKINDIESIEVAIEQDEDRDEPTKKQLAALRDAKSAFSEAAERTHESIIVFKEVLFSEVKREREAIRELFVTENSIWFSGAAAAILFESTIPGEAFLSLGRRLSLYGGLQAVAAYAARYLSAAETFDRCGTFFPEEEWSKRTNNVGEAHRVPSSLEPSLS
ncbi:MAG TPA: hypothetical protein VIS96_07140 [Terrimicrobiaceae bacterium]